MSKNKPPSRLRWILSRIGFNSLAGTPYSKNILFDSFEDIWNKRRQQCVSEIQDLIPQMFDAEGNFHELSNVFYYYNHLNHDNGIIEWYFLFFHLLDLKLMSLQMAFFLPFQNHKHHFYENMDLWSFTLSTTKLNEIKKYENFLVFEQKLDTDRHDNTNKKHSIFLFKFIWKLWCV